MTRQATRTYVRDFAIAMILYAVLLIGAVLVLPKLETSPWRFVVVVLPVVPVLYGMRALIRYLGQLDELGQRIQLQGIAFAAGMVAILTFTYGFLELAGLPPVSLIWVLPLMVMLWGIGTALASRKYE